MTRPVDVGVRPASAGTIAAPPLTNPPAVGRPLHRFAVPGLAVAAFLARLPLSTRPLSPDEAGFLMVAAQWHPGSSLYGDYWVDRPPMLLILFRLAELLGGGPVSLRLLGASFVAVSVLLAAALGRTAGGLVRQPARRSRLAPLAAGATAAVFLVSPLFGATEVDGELLAVPFVLAGVIAALTATGSGRRPLLCWAVAGASAVAAAAVKQDMLEVFVVAAVLLAASVRQRGRRSPPGRRPPSPLGRPSRPRCSSAGLPGTAPRPPGSGTRSCRSVSRHPLSSRRPHRTPPTPEHSGSPAPPSAAVRSGSW